MTTEPITITYAPALDPEMIIPGPNIRADAQASPGLIESVRAVGVRVPVAVAMDGGGQYILLTGQRRRLAAVEAGKRIPALIFPEGTGDDTAERITSQWWENHGAQEMTGADEVQAVLDLGQVDGITPAEVAERLGVPKKAVRLAGKAGKSEAALDLLRSGQLDLEQAAQLAEYDGDDEAQTALASAAAHGRWAFDHAVQIRGQQAKAQACADKTAKALAKAGATVSQDPAPPDAWTRADLLTTSPGSQDPLPEDVHGQCPGRAWWVEPWYEEQANAVEYCTDPEANGHGIREVQTIGSRGTQQTDEEATAERRYIRAGNIAFRAARDVRFKFWRQWLAGRRTLPPEQAEWLTTRLIDGPAWLQSSMRDNYPVGGILLGLADRDPDCKDKDAGWYAGAGLAAKAAVDAPPKRRQVILFASVIGAAEEAMTDAHTWQPSGYAYRFIRVPDVLDLAAGLGYDLSPVEQAMRDGTRWEPEAES